MKRGKHKLYDSQIENALPASVGSQSQRNALIAARDQKLVYRFYYHAHLCRKRYDDSINELMKEFDLTPNTIVDRLMNHSYDLLQEVTKKEKPDPTDLARLYPFYSWCVMRTS